MPIPQRTRRSPALRWALAVAILPVSALAAGYDIPEDGALPLGQGGTVTGLLDTAYALQFNPAGLALGTGLDVRADLRVIDHGISFARDPRVLPNGNEIDYAKVSNTGGLYPAPRASASFRLPGKLDFLGVGLGGWGPPGVGRYRWPDPAKLAAQGMEGEELEAATSSRYSLISSDIIIAMLSAGAGASLLGGKLAFGAVFEAVYADVAFSQSLVALPSADIDARIDLTATDVFTPAGLFGAAWRPVEGLTFAASYRTIIPVDAPGTVGVQLPEIAKNIAHVEGNKATLQQNLPFLGRAGVSYARGRFAGSLEGIWEGWSAVDRLVVTPHDIFIVDTAGKKTKIEPIIVEKHWVDAFGARLGGSARVLDEGTLPGLTVLAGGLYEGNAIPPQYQGVDFVTGSRIGVSAGLSGAWKGFSLTLSGMWFTPSTVKVTDSRMPRVAATPEPEPQIIGNGTYETSAWVLAAGLSWTGYAPEAPAVQ